MYWAAVSKIQRANLDGSGIEDLVTEVVAVGIALDVGGDKMYWTGDLLAGIGRANLDGSGVEESTPCCGDDIALDLTAPEPTATPTPTPGAVGGIAELPGVAGTPLEAQGSSGRDVASLAAVVAAGVVALAGGAWYARRRWLR